MEVLNRTAQFSKILFALSIVLLSTILVGLPSYATVPVKRFIPLTWVGEDPGLYEIEISHTDDKVVLYTKQVKSPWFKFETMGPGKYFWRVRTGRAGKWSPFSEYGEIDIKDRITQITRPLMISPIDGTELPLERDNNEVKFNWETPSKEFKYYLEIYKDPEQAPSKVTEVLGKTKKLKFPVKSSTYWWRVMAKGRYGDVTANTEKYRFTTRPEIKIRDEIIIRAGVSLESTTYEQKIDDNEFESVNKVATFSGQSFNGTVEYWPKGWKNKNALALSIEYSSLTSSDGDFSKINIISEYGQSLTRNARTKQQLFLGLHLGQVEVGFVDIPGNTYSASYGSLRYFYQKILNRKFSFDLNAEMLMLLQSEFVMPSFRFKPVLNYKLSQQWSVTAFAGFERTIATPFYSEAGNSGYLKITNQTLRYGLGAVWLY